MNNTNKVFSLDMRQTYIIGLEQGRQIDKEQSTNLKCFSYATMKKIVFALPLLIGRIPRYIKITLNFQQGSTFIARVKSSKRISIQIISKNKAVNHIYDTMIQISNSKIQSLV